MFTTKETMVTINMDTESSRKETLKSLMFLVFMASMKRPINYSYIKISKTIMSYMMVIMMFLKNGEITCVLIYNFQFR